ncbi:hypothetical protein Pmani_006302 [Petrolisthes manimaculis]|uniref:Sorbitol dehydrogenase n=1 Tax=Petrolisthes manimaculis TaxID=1843537 RepID=A0AAE1QC15_9EUCA|nr:hypothetical protein Pmani_006302 [Petrolisthes manimaculis]
MTTTLNEYPVLHGVADIRMETHPLPEIGRDEVLLRMSSVGLCGSDLSLVFKGSLGDYQLTPPLGIGHEAAGVVQGLLSFLINSPGDRVALEPGDPCWKCEMCSGGHYNVCFTSDFHAAPVPNPGCISRYYKHKAALCHKLPESVSQDEGAMMEPLSVAIHACRRAHVGVGSSVLICGAGAIGLFCLLAAKAMGATHIIMTDIRESALKKAKDLGADHTLLVKGGEDGKVLACQVERVMGCRPSSTLECTGVPSSAALAIYATRSSGAVVLVGIGAEDVALPIFNAAIREVDIRGTFRYVDCYPVAIDMVAKGMVDIKPLITHRFEFQDVTKAFETLRRGSNVIKCVVSC